MSRLTKKNLLEHLNKSAKQDIINEVLVLFDKFRNVKEYYKAELSDDANPLLVQYKRKISEAYAAANPKERRTNLNVNRIIQDFKKISVLETDTIDLMLHRVECGMEAVKRNSRRTATFYNCIISTFAGAVKLMDSPVIWNENKPRLEKIIAGTANGNYEMGKRMKAILER